MAARFVNIDRDTPMLMPPDMRDWVSSGHLVHFILDAVSLLDLSTAHVNHRGSGDAQYPPATMLALLIYSYATGSFSSRQIERSTYDSVPVRYLCAGTHPDHDSICTFRVNNGELLAKNFHQVLELAARAKLLQVGNITLAMDGTKILANASKHSAVSHGHAVEQMQLLEAEIAALLARAAAADSAPLRDGLSIPAEIERRQDRFKQLQAAAPSMRERAAERHAQEQAEYLKKLQERSEKERQSGRKPRGKAPKPPQEGPKDSDQFNFTDPESRIMKSGSGQHFEQAYNAQAAVEVDSRLIIAGQVVDAPNDKEQLQPTLSTLSPVIQSVGKVLVDSGFYSEAAVQAVERSSSSGALATAQVLAATQRHKHGRRIADLEIQAEPAALPPQAPFIEQMQRRLQTAEGRKAYDQRKSTIEPVFGIIKAALGFRRFSLRGLNKVNLEWKLVSLSYNLKRLFHMGAKLQNA
ncbi:MAG: transposase [Prosthecobacter sp.]